MPQKFIRLFVAISIAVTASAQTPGLRIYMVDVEGGNATLFVSPSGESLLVDTGNIGPAAPRDAGRILDALKDAGVRQIDHLIITHWHGDHMGGVEELASKIPIREFLDHGPPVQVAEANTGFLRDTYPRIYAAGKHAVAKVGDKISMPGVDIRVVTSAGNVTAPLRGTKTRNSLCGARPTEDGGEDSQSVGILVTFGKFRTAHLGDLRKDKEWELMCPVNRLGQLDVLLGLHHGQPTSNSDFLVHALAPRVAIMNNGPRKGGLPEVMKVLYTSPGLEDVWQMHFSVLGGQEYTSPGMFIANTFDDAQPSMPIAPQPQPAPGSPAPPAPAHNGQAHWIKVTANLDGSFSVTNSRNGFTKQYPKVTDGITLN